MNKPTIQEKFAKKWADLTHRPMRTPQKNLKISADAHYLLKVFAAQRGLNITDCATVIIEQAVTSNDLSREILDAKLAELLRRG